MTAGTRRALLVAAMVAAAVPRLVQLGALSFHVDEDTSAFPARAVAEGGAARFPSGMAYHRELLATGLYALSARLFGTGREASYRLPVALLGAATVPVLYVAARTIVSPPAALAAAALLALSEWHLVFSRQARTYTLLLLAVVLAAAAVQRWIEGNRRRDLMLAALAVAVAVSLHQAGVLVVVFVWLPFAFAGYARVSLAKASAFGIGAIVAAVAWRELVVQPAYRLWPPAPPSWMMGVVFPERSPLPGVLGALPTAALASALLGALLGAWIAVRGFPPASGAARVLRLGAAAAAGVMAAVGQLYGAAVFGCALLMMTPGGRADALRRTALPVAALVLLASVWTAFALTRLGIMGGLRSLAVVPFPMPLLLARSMPGLIGLFASACLWAALVPPEPGTVRLRVVLIAALALMTAPTLGGGAPPPRYVFHAYPFVLMGAAAVLVAVTAIVIARPEHARWRMPAVLAVIAVGVLGAHGLPQTWRTVFLRPGEPVDELLHIVPFRPDYRSAGTFLRQERRPGDVVVAEEVLSTLWYAGAADYWLRGYRDARGYVHRSPDGSLRDNYAGARLLHDRRSLEALLRRDGRVWLMTSGEVRRWRHALLAEDQVAWLDSLEARGTPAFIARDGATRVYCFGCDSSLASR